MWLRRFGTVVGCVGTNVAGAEFCPLRACTRQGNMPIHHIGFRRRTCRCPRLRLPSPAHVKLTAVLRAINGSRVGQAGCRRWTVLLGTASCRQYRSAQQGKASGSKAQLHAAERKPLVKQLDAVVPFFDAAAFLQSPVTVLADSCSGIRAVVRPDDEGGKSTRDTGATAR